MAEQVNIEEHLLRIAVTETQCLSAKASELSLKDYPTKGAYSLLRAIEALAEAIRQEVSHLREQAPTAGLMGEDRIEYMCLPIRLVQILHGMLDYVEKANTESNPYGISTPFFSLVRKIQRDTEIIMRPQWEYMYSLTNAAELVRKVANHCLLNPPGVEEALPKYLLVLSYPATHKQSGLMHVIQAHEIGHFFDNIYGISSAILGKINPEALGLEDLADSLARTQIGTVLHPDLFYQAALETNRARFRRELLQILKNWIEEMVADAFAIRVSGPAYFFALADFSLSVGPLTLESPEHPRPMFRLRHLTKDIEVLGYRGVIPSKVVDMIDEWSLKIQDLGPQGSSGTSESLERVLSREPPGVGLHVSEMVSEKIRSERMMLSPERLQSELDPLISLLETMIPPIEIVSCEKMHPEPASVFSAINAGWVCYVSKLEELAIKYGGESTERNISKVVDIINAHLLKVVEVNELRAQFRDSDLSKKEESSPLLAYMYDSSRPLSERLVISPMLSQSTQLEGWSVDLRLGSEFILPVRSRFPVLDPDSHADDSRYASSEIKRYQERLYRPYGNPFVLNPGEFVLGSTLEYIQVPGSLTGFIVGRSSWGRLGLNIATATAVAPGYSGVLTLELVNHGNAPLMLYPGTRIAQLILSPLPDTVPIYAQRRLSKYRFPTTVGFSRIRDDKDWNDLKPIIVK